MANSSCWNEISDNTSYIITKIIKDDRNIFDKRIHRQKTIVKKKPKPLNQITHDLFTLYDNLYDIILYVYRSERKRTIIEIQYYPKSSLEPDFFRTVKEKAPMLHSKLGIPPYAIDQSRKYDVNWELGGIRHEWKMFWHRVKFKQKYRNIK